MKKVITPAALKHIIVPFFAIILIFCNSLNFIKADETQTTQASALGTITEDDVTYVVDCSVTGVSVYNDSLGVWNTYPKFTAYVVADQPVNGYFTFQFHFSYAYAGTDIRYINLCVELSDGYGTLELVGSESYNYGGMYTDCSIDNMDVYVLSTSSDTIEVDVDTSITEWLLMAQYTMQNYVVTDISNLSCSSIVTNPAQGSTTITTNTYQYYIMRSYRADGNYMYLVIPMDGNSSSTNKYYWLSNGAIYCLNYSCSRTNFTYYITKLTISTGVESNVSGTYVTILYGTNDNPFNENALLEEKVQTSNSWLSNIYNAVINIYEFLTDDTDTAAATEIDNTVSDLQSATSTVESTQSDFTAQLQDYSAGIDLDDYDFDSTSAFTATNTYYKYILTETYNASGEFKYLLIIPLILAVFCFIVGVV